LRVATEQLDIDEIADLAPDLPHHVIRDVFKSLPIGEREQLRAAMSYDEDSVGALMDFNMVHVREDVTLEVVSRYLRRFDELPDHTDQVSWLTATIASRVCCRSILSSSTSRRRLSAT
jgi:magnesium transporter